MIGTHTESSNEDAIHDDKQIIVKSEMDTSLTFDTVRFIAEVERRPAIYNHDNIEYADRSFRNKAWTEVCEIMIPNWSYLSSENKTAEAKALKNRWRNMRDYFMKEFKYETSQNANQSRKKRKRCVYYDQLLFLVPNAKTRKEERNEQERLMAQDVTDEEYAGDISNAGGTFEFVTTSDYQNSTGEASMASSNDEFVNVLRIKQEPEPKQDDEDYDRMFLLSLLPMMRKLPEDRKLDVRIQMQQSIALALKDQQQN